MTPAEFRGYAEMAGWAVIGLYILARIVRGDREISVRIGGSKRKIKLREIASRLEACEGKLFKVEEERRASVPSAAHSWVEKTNKEVAEKLQALYERHDHLSISVANARARAEEALAPAEYAEKMIDRMMRVLAWLAWRSGVKLKADFCQGATGNSMHRSHALGLASSFGDIGAEDEPPTLLINDNHCPFPVECDANGIEFVRQMPEVPDHASINSLDALLKVTRDELVALKRNLRLHPGAGDKRGLLSGNGMADLIDLLCAAVFADEMPKDAREFSRQFGNAIRLARRTAGEANAEHIAEPETPKPLDEVQWALRLRAAAKAFGENNLQGSDALGVETPWGLAYLSLQRPLEIWFAHKEPTGPRKVLGFHDGATNLFDGDVLWSVSFEDSQRVVHLRKIVCVGNEAELIRGELVPLSVGMENAVEVAPPTLADVDSKAGADQRDFQLRCAPSDTQCRARARYHDWQCQQDHGHDGPHRNANYTWVDTKEPAVPLCGAFNPGTEGDTIVQCNDRLGHDGVHSRGELTWDNTRKQGVTTTPRVSLCADCREVGLTTETTDGELCERCLTKQIEKENRAKCEAADATMDDAQWEGLLEEIAQRLGDGSPLTPDTRLMVATAGHGRAWLKLKTPNRLLFEDAARVVTELNVWDDPAGSCVTYHNLGGDPFLAYVHSIGEETPASMCDHCGKVETNEGELCPACVAYEVEEDRKKLHMETVERRAREEGFEFGQPARPKAFDNQWCDSLREIAGRLGDAVLTMDSRILIETKQHGPAYLAPHMRDALLFKYGHHDVEKIEVWDDPAGPLVMYQEGGVGYIGTAVSMSERLDDFERAFRAHGEAKAHPLRTVVGTATVTFDEAVKQATNPPADVMRFWDQMREDSALVTLFEKQAGQTLYTFGTAGAKVPMIGDPLLTEDGVVVGAVLDYNNNRDGDCFATCEATEVFVAPVIRVIEPCERDDYR